MRKLQLQKVKDAVMMDDKQTNLLEGKQRDGISSEAVSSSRRPKVTPKIPVLPFFAGREVSELTVVLLIMMNDQGD